MTNEQLEQLRALVAAGEKVANIVLNARIGMPGPLNEWRHIHQAQLGLANMTVDARPALKALLARVDALEAVARAAQSLAGAGNADVAPADLDRVAITTMQWRWDGLKTTLHELEATDA